ncbi:Fanconi anemia group D2 protein-like isoform X2 [Babylonia areolata]
MPSNVFKSKSMFAAVCKKAGLILKNGEENNEISVDKSVFQKNLTTALKRQQGDINEVIEEFLEGFGDYTGNEQRFHKSLLPTMTTKDCESARSKVQDSVVRILLGVECLQPPLVKSLLEKLPEFSQDDEDGEGANLPRLLLAQFRWLDFVVDSKNMTSMLLELIEATELDVQREIISALPSMVDDSDHAAVASKLKDLLVSETQLTVVILDALVCLDLPAEILTQVRGSATRALQSVDVENLPVVLKFLLKTTPAAELPEVIGEIRNGLDLYSLVRSAKGAKKAKTDSDESQDCVVLIVDTLQSGIQFQRGIADAWLKSIDGEKEKLGVLELVIVLILHQTKHRKPVESLVRNKIRNGAVTETLLQTAFTSHSQVMQSKFKAVLSLAEVLLKSPEVSLSYIGHVLYKLAFRSLNTFCRQEIVANLVMHLGSGNSEESDASLDVLADLVEHHLSAMAPFAIFFKRLLDFQQQSLSLLAMRKLFGMLARLAFSASQDIALIQDDLHMVIRKLVSSMDTKYLCRGVVGGVMMVWGMGSTSGQEAELSESRLNEVVSLLTMIRSGSSRRSEAAALFLDELAAMVSHGNLHKKVETWILENMTDMFQENFVVDIEEENTSVVGIPMSPQFCLNDKEESSIVINLLPQVAKEIMEAKSSSSSSSTTSSQNMVYSVCLSPHFRLVQTGERQLQEGNMEGIDALLGCPLYLPEEAVYTKLESLSDREKDVLCTSLFHGLNWFREIVNAFASQSDTEMKGKVIERLHDITHLTQVLAKCLAAHPKYSPSLLGLGGEDVKQTSAASTSKGKGTGDKKRGRKRKHAEKENESTQSEVDTTQNVTTQSEKQSTQDGDDEDDRTSADGADLSAFAHCFRELDLEVFSILHSGPITQASLDTDLHTTRARQVQIQTPQLQFLMEDLVKKLNHSLIATASKRRAFPGKTKSGGGKPKFSNLDQQKPQQVAVFMVDLLPALCTHLEATSAFFQTLIADNDGVMDGPGSHSPEALRMASCLHLLLHALIAVFSWNGFGLAENRQLWKDSLSVLVGRVKVTGPTQQSVSELIKGAYQYIEKFSDTVPNLPSAASLVRLLTVLANRAEDETLQHKLAELSHQLLKREWLDGKGQREKGAACNEMLQTLVKTWVSNSADPPQAMQLIADTGMTELLQAGAQSGSDTYPTLTRSSFPVFLRVILSELVGTVKRTPPLKRTDPRQVQEDRLLGWSVAVRVLFMAVGIVKELNSRAGIAASLKYSRQFVEVFLLRGMPVLDATFTSHSADVHSLLRSLQQSTRILQNMCGHAKRTQDVSQVNQVPVLKRALERLVLRVKHMLSVNNCQRAFWMGNLKNKTLQGEEILSQAQSQESTTTNEEEETMPDDDDDSEVEMDTTEKDASDESGDGSISDTY